MVSIIEVTDKAQLRRFVDYPNELYKDVPQFVPATYGDDLSDWDRSKNPAFEYCDARCWLAMRDRGDRGPHRCHPLPQGQRQVGCQPPALYPGGFH